MLIILKNSEPVDLCQSLVLVLSKDCYELQDSKEEECVLYYTTLSSTVFQLSSAQLSSLVLFIFFILLNRARASTDDHVFEIEKKTHLLRVCFFIIHASGCRSKTVVVWASSSSSLSLFRSSITFTIRTPPYSSYYLSWDSSFLRGTKTMTTQYFTTDSSFIRMNPCACMCL